MGLGSVADFEREDLVVNDVFAESYLVALNEKHALATNEMISVADLAGQVLLDRPSCEMRDKLLAKLEESNVDLYASQRANSYPWIIAQVQENVGLAVVPESIARSGFLNVEFKALSEVELCRKIGFVRSVQQPTRRQTQNLINFVVAVLKDIHPVME